MPRPVLFLPIKNCCGLRLMLMLRYLVLGLFFVLSTGPWSGTAHAQEAATSTTLQYQQAMAGAVRTAAKKVLSSVVSIEVIGASGAAEGEVERDAPTSGVVVDAEGLILTSSLVATRPTASLLAVFEDGTRHAARIVARDEHRDLVLLKVDVERAIEPIVFDSSKELRVGQTVIALGRYGNESSPLVSRGILSAQQRLDGIALQCDARVSPSFYGGPLIDLYGRVIGILIPAVAEGGAESPTSWYDSGIAFAIPMDVIARKLGRLKQGNSIQKGMIGIVSRSSDPYSDGTTISAVRARSPAELAGVEAGDEVLEVAGIPVRRQLQIRQVLGSYDAGETISVKLKRKDMVKDVKVTLAASIPALQPQRLGLVLSDQFSSASNQAVAAGENEATASDDETQAETPPEEAAGDPTADGARQVVVDAIVPDFQAAEPFEVGDVITGIGPTSVNAVQDVRRLLMTASPNQTLSLSLLRAGEPVALSINPETITGSALGAYPSVWNSQVDTDWEVKDWKLPEAGNAAAYAGPKEIDQLERLGLLVLLMNPGEGSPKVVAESWLKFAKKTGVVLCAIAAEDQQRWLPKEVEVIARFAASLQKQAPIDSSAIAIATSGALANGDGNAADSMAIAVALAKRQIFSGVAVSSKSRPPAIRLAENDGQGSFQMMLPSSAKGEIPGWAEVMIKAGYPVVSGGETSQESLLQWVRLLQVI